MNPRHLKHFLRVAELGSLSKASLVLYIAQPALSRQMTQLEHDLGAALFVRSERGVSLTDAGQQLRERGEALLRDIEDLKHSLSSAAELPSSRLDVLLTPSLAALVAAPTAAAFIARYPQVELNMFEGPSGIANPWSWILEGRVHFAVGTTLEPMADMYSAPFAVEPLCLFGPADAGLTPDVTVPMQRLTTLPLWLPSRGNTIRLILEARLAALNMRVNTRASTTSPSLMIEAVSRGDAYTVLPYCSGALAHRAGRVSVAPLEGTQMIWNFMWSRDRALSQAAQAYQAMWRTTVADVVASGRWPTATPLSADSSVSSTG